MLELSYVLSFAAAVIGIGALRSSKEVSLINRLSPRKTLSTKVIKLRKSDPTLALLELPDFSSILWFLLSSGLGLEQALRLTVSRCGGSVSEEFQRIIQNVDHGAILQHELDDLAITSTNEAVRELALKLSLALANGSSLSEQLAEFTHSATAELRTKLLDKSHRNETKMMVPLVFVILPVTVVFALYPSVVLIQQSF
ncbi:MAG: hypothetical protein EBR26_05605 [Microbacteriaceae bacterium]|nr:hypothetical protein [Microbacteriaceae bacterium]